MDRELVIVLDFGGQYNQLIARRVRECNVYCEVHPYTLSLDKIREMNPKGIIFTGGPNSVYGEDSPRCPKEIFEMGIPILGICYGSQLMSYMLGGSVKTAPVSESEKSFLLGKSSVYSKERDLNGGSGSQRGSSTFVGKGAASDKRTGTGTVAIPCAGSGRKLGDAGLGNASCRQSVKGINFFASEGLTKIG